MKSPLIRIFCTCLGIAAAGTPLIWFTASDAALPPAEELHAVEHVPVSAALRCSGAEVEVIIRHEGRIVVCLCPDGGDWQGELDLPPLHAGDSLELELEAHWSAPTAGRRAISLELMPPLLPSRADTQWSEQDSPDSLHSIYTYAW